MTSPRANSSCELITRSWPIVRSGSVPSGSLGHSSTVSALRARILVRHASPPVRMASSNSPRWISCAVTLTNVCGLFPPGVDRAVSRVRARGARPRSARVAVAPRQEADHADAVGGGDAGQTRIGGRPFHRLGHQGRRLQGVVEAVGAVGDLAGPDQDEGAVVEASGHGG